MSSTDNSNDTERAQLESTQDFPSPPDAPARDEGSTEPAPPASAPPASAPPASAPPTSAPPAAAPPAAAPPASSSTAIPEASDDNEITSSSSGSTQVESQVESASGSPLHGIRQRLSSVQLVHPGEVPGRIPTAGGITLGADATAERERRRQAARSDQGPDSGSHDGDTSVHPALRSSRQSTDLATRTRANTEANRGAAIVPQLGVSSTVGQDSSNTGTSAGDGGSSGGGGGLSRGAISDVEPYTPLRRAVTYQDSSSGAALGPRPPMPAAGLHPQQTGSPPHAPRAPRAPLPVEALRGLELPHEMLHRASENVNPRQPPSVGPSSSSAAIEEQEGPAGSGDDTAARQDSTAPAHRRASSGASSAASKFKEKVTDGVKSIKSFGRKITRSSSSGDNK